MRRTPLPRSNLGGDRLRRPPCAQAPLRVALQTVRPEDLDYSSSSGGRRWPNDEAVCRLNPFGSPNGLSGLSCEGLAAFGGYGQRASADMGSGGGALVAVATVRSGRLELALEASLEAGSGPGGKHKVVVPLCGFHAVAVEPAPWRWSGVVELEGYGGSLRLELEDRMSPPQVMAVAEALAQQIHAARLSYQVPAPHSRARTPPRGRWPTWAHRRCCCGTSCLRPAGRTRRTRSAAGGAAGRARAAPRRPRSAGRCRGTTARRGMRR
jgi:hypothetical protein